MSEPTDTDLIARICRDATARSGPGTVAEVVRDPFGDTTWACMSSRPRAREALAGLNSHGISGHDIGDGRLRIAGLRREGAA